MASLKEYFEQNRYKPKYMIGDRVRGFWHGIPFVGTVGNDTVINEANGPQISVLLDLPIKYEELAKELNSFCPDNFHPAWEAMRDWAVIVEKRIREKFE